MVDRRPERPPAAGDRPRYRYTFANFGNAPALHAPPASQVETTVYRGQTGQSLKTLIFTLDVSNPQVGYGAGPNVAPGGYRNLRFQVMVSNTSTVPIGIPLGEPVVTSPEGGEYWQDASQEAVDLPTARSCWLPARASRGRSCSRWSRT